MNNRGVLQQQNGFSVELTQGMNMWHSLFTFSLTIPDRKNSIENLQ
jgi:hypothetical protein